MASRYRPENVHDTDLFGGWHSTRVTIFVGEIVTCGAIILIAKRSQNVAGGCSEAETPGTESNW